MRALNRGDRRSVGPQTAPYDAAIEKDGRLTASGDNKGVKGTSTARFRHAVYKNSWAVSGWASE